MAGQAFVGASSDDPGRGAAAMAGQAIAGAAAMPAGAAILAASGAARVARVAQVTRYSAGPRAAALPISRSSALIARSRWAWVSGACSSAARNAARSAALRM